MKIQSSRYTLLLLVFACLALLGCPQSNPHTNGGSTTEAENAIAMMVTNPTGKPLLGAHVSLCTAQAFCASPTAETWSDSSGFAKLDSIPDGTYQLGIVTDSADTSWSITLNGDTLNLGNVILAAGTIGDTTKGNDTLLGTWIGAWLNTFISVDSTTITTEYLHYTFQTDSTMLAWSWTKKIDTTGLVAYAPAETLSLQAQWHVVGNVIDIFTTSYATFHAIDSLYPEWKFANAKAILTPIITNTNSMRWFDGCVLSNLGDSLLFLGDIQVYSGTATSLSGSSWTSATQTIQALTLATDGSATVTKGSQSYTGTWSISSFGKLQVAWTEGTTSYTLNKYYAIQNGQLLLMDLDDPGIFMKQ